MSKFNLFINKYFKYILIVSMLIGVIFIYASFDYLFIFRKVLLNILIALLFICIVGLILLYVYKEYGDKSIGIISTVIVSGSLLMMTVFAAILLKINLNINNTYDNDNYYEENIYISCYIKNHDYKDINDLKNVDDLIIGVVENKDEDYLGKNKLDDIFDDYSVIEYEDNFSLFKALINDPSINLAVFASDYKLSVNGSPEYTYVQYLDDVRDLYSFDEKIKNNKESLKNYSFNVLLIGYAPEDKNETLGYADSIMLATINLDTLFVNLTSIPRSSDVRYACEGNIRDRINETILDSEKCLLDTSADLLDTEIDYYIEINFNGLVEIVDAIGGIDVISSVEFVGQTSSADRGTKTVYVPAGEYVWLNGEQALAFARERNAYSSKDDLTRQSNQRQVLERIAQKLIENRNVYQLLKIIDILGDNVKTNISKDQILNILNRVAMMKDYTGISLYKKLIITSRQLIGEYVDSYIYYLRSPMSVYRLYDKTIKQANNRISAVLAKYSKEDIVQATYMYLSPEFTHYDEGLDLDFTDEELEETIPNYYPLLIGENLDFALSWAKENNVTLKVEYIKPGDDLYNEDKNGEIIYQSVSYGNLVDEHDTCTVKVVTDE